MLALMEGLGAASLFAAAALAPVDQPPPIPPFHGALPTSPKGAVIDYTADCGEMGLRHIRLAHRDEGSSRSPWRVREISGSGEEVSAESLRRMDEGLASLDVVVSVYMMCQVQGAQIIVNGFRRNGPARLSFSWLRGSILQHDAKGRLPTDTK